MAKDQQIGVAVDVVILTIREGELMALLIEMKKKPFTGRWAFPGGFIGQRETARQAAERILHAQTGVAKVYLDQLATFDSLKRDPAGRVVSIAHYALMPSEGIRLKTTKKYAAVRWWPVKKLPPLAYDHDELARVAVKRLRARLEYTNVVWSLLPPEFTLTELQGIYEVILGKKLDKRNFRRNVLSLRLLAPLGRRRAGAHRPAELYRFKHRRLELIDII